MAFSIGYDHINKRLLAVEGDERISIPVTVVGTKHAQIAAADVAAKAQGVLAVEDFVKALKKYRNNNGKSFIVTVV